MERSIGQGVEVSCFKLLQSGKDWPFSATKLDGGLSSTSVLFFSRAGAGCRASESWYNIGTRLNSSPLLISRAP
jgi:hypothetical protein